MDDIVLRITIMITWSYYIKIIGSSLSLLWSIFDIMRGDQLDNVTKCCWRIFESDSIRITMYTSLWVFGLLRRLLRQTFFLITVPVYFSNLSSK